MGKTTKTADIRAYALIIILGAISYYHILSYTFTYLDDASLVMDTAKKMAQDPLAVFRLFTQNHLSIMQPQIFYRPVFAASFMLNSLFCGGNLTAYYLVNIALHIIASCLLFNLLTRLGYKKNACLLLTSLYVIHPMMTQTVAWLPGRSDTLAAIFSILSFISFIKFIDKERLRYYFTHLASLALALFSKENALCVAVICFVYMRIIERRKFFSKDERLLIAGWVIVLSLWFWLRSIALQDPLKLTLYEMAGFLTKNLIVIVQYIGRVFWPINLSVWPTIQDSSWIPGAWAIVILTMLLYFSKGKRLNYILFGAAWFILALLPALIRPDTGISGTFSNTRLYLSIIGLIIILAETDMVRCADIKKWHHAIIIILVFIFYSLITHEHSLDFRNSASFWANARRTAPHSWIDPDSIK